MSGRTRRHDLDALRASAMLLGVFYHVALSFGAVAWWRMHDVSHRGIYIVQAGLHGFRMPLFFMVSGFFTAMLWRRRGLKGLLRNRFQRIFIPCLLGVVTLVPAMNWSSRYATQWQLRKRTAEMARQAPDTDLWTAAASGRTDAVARVIARGADVNALNAKSGVTPLTLAALWGHTQIAAQLLDAGADLNARNSDGGMALHAAALLGRAEIADLLSARGADVRARSDSGESVVRTAYADWGFTEYKAQSFALRIDRAAVSKGRAEVIARLAQLGVVDPPDPGPKPSRLGSVIRWLTQAPVLKALWFLWFLCWMVLGLSVYTVVAKHYGWKTPPRWLVLSPARILIWAPLTIAPQWFMTWTGGAFGSDTPVGLLPMPHIFGFYALFFAFGVFYYESDDREELVGRGWRWTLPFSLLVVLPLAIAFASGSSGLASDLLPVSYHHHATVLLQVLYVWLMVFTSVGMFRALLTRESRTLHYLSDSAYWIYLSHLPFVMLAQPIVSDWAMADIWKCLLVSLVIMGFLLAIYDAFIRYSWIGALLNGPRRRKLPQAA